MTRVKQLLLTQQFLLRQLLSSAWTMTCFIKFGIHGVTSDIRQSQSIQGLRVLTPPKLQFPINLLHHPYNNAHTTMLHSDHVMLRL